ncbi:MAG: porin [Oligoflexia bacterium]|nr:porin [Oligoflexia bacterium]
MIKIKILQSLKLVFLLSLSLILSLSINAFSSAAITASTAIDTVTVYGLLKKEMRYIKQSSEANYRTTYGPKDVDGVESRFGIKGSLPLSTITTKYKLEVGFNSARDNKGATDTANSTNGPGDERIRVRSAVINLNNQSLGTLSFGQDNTPGIARNTNFDPLYGTSVEIIAQDLIYFAGAILGASMNHPILPRSTFYNQLAYETPSIFGFQLAIAHDRNSQSIVQRNSGANVQQWWTSALYFDKIYSNIKIAATAVYADQDKEGIVPEDHQYFWQIFVKTFFQNDNKIDKFSIGMGFYQTKVNRNNKNKSFSAVASYDIFSDLILSGSYYKTILSDDASASSILGTTGEQSQYASGLIYKFNNNVKAHLVFAFFTRSWDVTPTNVFEKSRSKSDNSGYNTALGMTITF